MVGVGGCGGGGGWRMSWPKDVCPTIPANRAPPVVFLLAFGVYVCCLARGTVRTLVSLLWYHIVFMVYIATPQFLR